MSTSSAPVWAEFGILIGVIQVSPAIRGTSELTTVAREEAGPELVLESMTRAVGFIDGEPFLVAPVSRAALHPGLAAIY